VVGFENCIGMPNIYIKTQREGGGGEGGEREKQSSIEPVSQYVCTRDVLCTVYTFETSSTEKEHTHAGKAALNIGFWSFDPTAFSVQDYARFARLTRPRLLNEVKCG